MKESEFLLLLDLPFYGAQIFLLIFIAYSSIYYPFFALLYLMLPMFYYLDKERVSDYRKAKKIEEYKQKQTRLY